MSIFQALIFLLPVLLFGFIVVNLYIAVSAFRHGQAALMSTRLAFNAQPDCAWTQSSLPEITLVCAR